MLKVIVALLRLPAESMPFRRYSWLSGSTARIPPGSVSVAVYSSVSNEKGRRAIVRRSTNLKSHVGVVISCVGSVPRSKGLGYLGSFGFTDRAINRHVNG